MKTVLVTFLVVVCLIVSGYLTYALLRDGMASASDIRDGEPDGV